MFLPTLRLAGCRAHRLASFDSSVFCCRPPARALSWRTSRQGHHPQQPSQLATARRFSTSPLTADDAALSEKSPSSGDGPVAYRGPMTQTFRRLKLFSLSSLGFSCIMTPFIFIVESSLPFSARVVLAVTALSTSSISTALVGWSGAPYVVNLRRLPPANNGGIEGIEMTTLTLMLKTLVTRVYDADFLVETKRPFAKWELAQTILLPPPTEDAVMAAKGGAPGEEETIAETFNSRGEIVGRWIVKWNSDSAGTCRGTGTVVRCVIFVSRICRKLTSHIYSDTSTCTRSCCDTRKPMPDLLVIVIFFSLASGQLCWCSLSQIGVDHAQTT